MATLAEYSALSFDVYGTLIDWESGMIAGLRPLTDRLDIPIPTFWQLSIAAAQRNCDWASIGTNASGMVPACLTGQRFQTAPMRLPI